MKILRVIPTVDPEYGGPIEGLLRTAQAHATQGHETTIVCLDDPSAPWLAACAFPVQACGPGMGRYGFSLALPHWLRQHAAEFDVVVLHGLWNFASLGAWLGLRGTGLPYVQFVHGMLDPWFNSVQPVKRWSKQLYWTMLQARVLADAQAVLFTTEEERRRAKTSFWGGRYAERVVAYGAANPPSFTAHQAAAFHKAVPSLGQRPYLLYLGRLHPKKGCDLLVQAFAAADHNRSDLQLVIAGPDPTDMRADLETIARTAGTAHAIHFPGMLKGDAKWGGLRGAEAFVLPSHQENFGIAVAEALSCGVPVLISDKVNIWREIQASGAGLVQPDDFSGTKALLDGFAQLDDIERDRMRTAALQCYADHFSIDGAAADLLDILQQAQLSGSPLSQKGAPRVSETVDKRNPLR